MDESKALIAFYQAITARDPEDFVTKRRKLTLPVMPAAALQKLLSAVERIFSNEPNVIRATAPIHIVGDVHGHLIDLLRVLNKHGYPPAARYIFLGDLVDRGEFSTEVVTLVFALKVAFPTDVFIVRGNHEFAEVCQDCGFFEELQKVYRNCPIFPSFLRVFSQTPFLVVVENTCVCLHGGIGPACPSIEAFAALKRPIHSFSLKIVSEVLWSDPDDDFGGFRPSMRGYGQLFGCVAAQAFLQASGLQKIVRGHQCVEGGIEESLHGNVLTVFGASNYCGDTGNKAGVLLIRYRGDMEKSIFEPYSRYLQRADVKFTQLTAAEPPLIPLSAVADSQKRKSVTEMNPRAVKKPVGPRRRCMTQLKDKKLVKVKSLETTYFLRR